MLIQNKLFYRERCRTIFPAISSANNMTINRLIQTRTISRFRIFVTTNKLCYTAKFNVVHHHVKGWIYTIVKNIVTFYVPYYSSSLLLAGKMQRYNFTNVTALAKAQSSGVELRTLDYENPGSNTGCGGKTLGKFFTLHCSSSLS